MIQFYQGKTIICFDADHFIGEIHKNGNIELEILDIGGSSITTTIQELEEIVNKAKEFKES